MFNYENNDTHVYFEMRNQTKISLVILVYIWREHKTAQPVSGIKGYRAQIFMSSEAASWAHADLNV